MTGLVMKHPKILVCLTVFCAASAFATGCTNSGGQTISTQPAHAYTRRQADAAIQQVQQDKTLSDAQKKQKITDINNTVIPVSGPPQ